MSDVRKEIKRIIRKAVNKKMTVEESADRLLLEFGRGIPILVLDNDCYGLFEPLLDMNYTVYKVTPGNTDAEIKKQIAGRVLISRNGKDFSSPNDLEKWEYGLIWLTTDDDNQVAAKKVKKVLMTKHFRANLKQVVKV
jgi:hypothetical protein